MADFKTLMETMMVRLEQHFDKLDEVCQAMIKDDRGSDFIDGYQHGMYELSRTVFFMNEAPIISDEHECGHLYACLLALGIDTAGLERD